MSRIAIIKIHPGLNMALPQLSGDLNQAGHKTKLFFFKDHEINQAANPSYTRELTINLDTSQDVSGAFDEDYYLLAQELTEFKPDAIGLSVISLSIRDAIKATYFLRKHFDVPIIWGGVGATIQPEIAILHADVVCVGEGEEVFIEFANCVQNNTDFSAIEGTWAKNADGEVIKNPKRPLCNLDNIAIPNWEPTGLRYITDSRVVKHKLAFQRLTHGDYQIMTQRGCPFSCSFCVESRYQEMFGKKNSLRRRSVDLVIEELVAAKEKFAPKVLWFWDDVFTVNPRWLKDFLPKYKEKVGIPFWCYTYPTTHNSDLLKELKAAGCNSVTMGVQSGSERILNDFYNRPTPLGRVIEAAQEIIDAGLVGYFDLITKSVFETEADLRSTFQFLIDMPQEMICTGHSEMKSYPTYSYTNQEDTARAGTIATSICSVDDKTYDYYHNLYLVARNPFIDKQEKLDIGNELLFREHPEMLERYFYGYRPHSETILLMREVIARGEHPNTISPPQDYQHLSFSEMKQVV